MLKHYIKKHLIVAIIGVCFIAPAFFYFSRRYLLFALIIALFVVAAEVYFRLIWKKEFIYDAYEITDNSSLKWVNDYVDKISLDNKINRPKFWVTRDIDVPTVLGDFNESHLIFPSSFVAYEGEDIVKAAIAHEVGHIVLYHSAITTAVRMIYMGLLRLPALVAQSLELLTHVPFMFIITVPLMIALIPLTLVLHGFFMFVYQALSIFIGRYKEYSADKFSFKYTNGGTALASYFEKYTSEDPTGVSKLFYFKDSPTNGNRAKRLRALNEKHSRRSSFSLFYAGNA